MFLALDAPHRVCYENQNTLLIHVSGTCDSEKRELKKINRVQFQNTSKLRLVVHVIDDVNLNSFAEKVFQHHGRLQCKDTRL